jgi:hypothetical protein
LEGKYRRGCGTDGFAAPGDVTVAGHDERCIVLVGGHDGVEIATVEPILDDGVEGLRCSARAMVPG